MDCSTSGFLVLHSLTEFPQTRVHCVSDAIQPSHPLSSPFSSCPWSFPASGSFLMSWLFTSGGQSIGASASTSVLPMNIQGWFLLGLTGLISLQSRDSQESSPTPQFKSINSSVLMAPHSSTLAWKTPWTEEPGRLQSMASLRIWHDWATSLSLFTFTHWRRKWQLTPVFLPGESHGQGSLVGCCLWGRTRVGHDWSDLAAPQTFFMDQLSHPYMTTGKPIALTI